MKKNLVIICLSLLTCSLFAQGNAETYAKEALDFIKAKNYKAAQTSLQDAINELNNAISKEALAAMPLEITGLKADAN
jgi:cellobiose-specific phosphotransferase system component IIA